MPLTLILKSDDRNTTAGSGEDGRFCCNDIKMERAACKKSLSEVHLNHCNIIIRLCNVRGEALDELFLRAKRLERRELGLKPVRKGLDRPLVDLVVAELHQTVVGVDGTTCIHGKAFRTDLLSEDGSEREDERRFRTGL